MLLILQLVYAIAGAIVLSMSGLLQLSQPVLMMFTTGFFFSRVFFLCIISFFENPDNRKLLFILSFLSLCLASFIFSYCLIMLIHSVRSMELMVIALIFFIPIIFAIFLKSNFFKNICFIMGIIMLVYHKLFLTSHFLYFLKLFTSGIIWGIPVNLLINLFLLDPAGKDEYYISGMRSKISAFYRNSCLLIITSLVITYILPTTWLLFPCIHFMASVIVFDAILSRICILLNQSSTLFAALILLSAQLAIYPLLLSLAPSAWICIITQIVHTLLLMYRHEIDGLGSNITTRLPTDNSQSYTYRNDRPREYEVVHEVFISRQDSDDYAYTHLQSKH